MSRATSNPLRHCLSVLSTLPAVLALAPACGDNLEGIPSVIEPASVYQDQCASPRSGKDPFTGENYPDVQGSVLDEKLWIRSWTNDLYLWYHEVPDVDIRSYKTAIDYFDVMKTNATTPSGKPKDQFHFIYKTSDWEALSQSGVEAGYGVQWALLASRPPRKLLVAYVEKGSPAEAAGLDRGAEVLTIDGADLKTSNDVDTLNNGLFPAALNENHTFVVVDRGMTASRTLSMTSASIKSVPVQKIQTLPAPNDKVGYFQFNDHIATAEKGLRDAVAMLQSQMITDLVIDMRYNGGGYLDIAAELGYMVAGPTRTAGKTFERESFNDKYQTKDPFGQPLVPTPFHDKMLGFASNADAGQSLPNLNLSRVFVLTGSGTCSASEAVMNGLSGVDVDVIQIGSTTCGKPYGFFPFDNCGTTYFSIQFQGVNQKGFGDYADGFIPGGKLHGCVVADDFNHALGDPAEGRLAAALAYRANGSCPAAFAPTEAQDTVVIPKSPWRQNRIVTPRR